MKFTLFAILAVTLGLIGFNAAAEETKVADISHEELVKAVSEKKVVLIDCNGSDSFNSGHIPGAVDFAAAKDALATKLPAQKDALVVSYCGNEHCPAYKAGAAAAAALGYTNVKHYAAGIAGWKKSGEKTETATQ